MIAIIILFAVCSFAAAVVTVLVDDEKGVRAAAATLAFVLGGISLSLLFQKECTEMTQQDLVRAGYAHYEATSTGKVLWVVNDSTRPIKLSIGR